MRRGPLVLAFLLLAAEGARAAYPEGVLTSVAETCIGGPQTAIPTIHTTAPLINITYSAAVDGLRCGQQPAVVTTATRGLYHIESDIGDTTGNNNGGVTGCCYGGCACGVGSAIQGGGKFGNKFQGNFATCPGGGAGSASYQMVIDQNTIRFDNRSFTIEFWARGVDVAYEPTYLKHCPGGGQNQCLWIRGGNNADDGKLFVDWGGPTNTLLKTDASWPAGTNLGLDDGGWHYVVFVYDASTKIRAIYIDGEPRGQDNAPTGQHYQGGQACMQFNRDAGIVGACGSVGGCGGTTGARDIDDVRFSETAMSYAAIRAHYRGSHAFYTSGGADQTPITFSCGDGDKTVNSFSGRPSPAPFGLPGGNTLSVRTLNVLEQLRKDPLVWTLVQDSLETPPTPVVTGLGATFVTWNWDPPSQSPPGPRYICDAPGRTQYALTVDGAGSVTGNKFYTGGAYTPNTRHCLSMTATYNDIPPGGSAAVGPSAATPTICKYTYALTPTNAPVVGAGIDGTSVNVTLNESPNAAGTSLDVEGNGSGQFVLVSDYQAVPNASASRVRPVSGLVKSQRYFFQTRAINNDGIPTNASPVSAGSYVTMPLTPQNFYGVPAPLPACGKTAIQWRWDAVPTGSGVATDYWVWSGGLACSATAPSQSCNETGFAPSPGGSQVSRVVYARDGGAGALSVFSSPSPGYAASTASSLIPQIQGVVGTSISPGVQWDWTAPPYLCSGWTYRITFPLGGAPLTLPANSTPQYIQVPMPVNSKSIIQVQALDPIDVVGSPLSVQATQYSAANPPANLRALAISSDTLVVGWDNNGNPGYTRYEAELSTGTPGAPFSVIVPVADNYTQLTTTITALVPAGTYIVRLKAYNGRAGEPFAQPTTSIQSTFVMQTTAPVLSGAPLSQTQVQWTWTQVANASRYELHDARDGSLMANVFPPAPMTFTQTIAAGNPNTRLSGYVWSFNNVGMANTSATSYVYTDVADPTGAAWTAVSSVSVSLAWNANLNPNPGTLYEVNVSTDGLFRVVVATRSALTTAATISGLFPGSTYYARVRAYSGNSRVSGYSVVQAAGLPLAAVTNANPAITLSASPASVYVPSGNVLGLWHFDDLVNQWYSTDVSDLHNSALLTCVSNGCASTPTFTGSLPTLSSAVGLSGQTSSLILIPYAATYDQPGSLTVAAWIKPATSALPAGTGIIVREDRTAGIDFSLDLDNDVFFGTRYRFRVGATAVYAPASFLTPGSWQRIVGRYDATAGGSVSIFIDGVLRGTTAGVPGRVITPGSPISIGNRKTNSGLGYAYDHGFIGAIDEVKLLGAALTNPEVAADYAGSFSSTVTLTGPNAGVSLYLPPNAFGGLATIYVSRDPINNPITIGLATLANGLAATPTGQILVPNTLIEIVPAVGGIPFSGPMGSSATITMSYPDADGDGLLDGVNPPISADTLRMYTLDASVVRWVPLPTTVDKNARTVTGTTPHFSVFAVFGAATIGTSLSQVRIFPNPWNRGAKTRYDAPALTFDNLPKTGTVRIFTLSGERVNELSFSGPNAGSLQWDGKNSSGRTVASGVYFAYVRADDDTSTAVVKFAIER